MWESAKKEPFMIGSLYEWKSTSQQTNVVVMETENKDYVVVHALNDVMSIGSIMDDIDDTFKPFIGTLTMTGSEAK